MAAALFLRAHTSWRPEDLGYPAGDYILFDLTKLIDRYEAAAHNAAAASARSAGAPRTRRR